MGARVGKKAVALAMAACLVVAYTPGLAYASELVAFDEVVEGSVVTADGWTLEYSAECGDDGAYEATITGVAAYAGEGGSLSIPESIELEDGSVATVTALGSYAFDSCAELTSVTMADTVTTMDTRVFYSCTALESIEMSEALEAVPEIAFKYCSALTSISIPASVAYIARNAFEACSSLQEVTFEGDSLEFLGFKAFYECTSLVEIVVPPLLGGDVSYRYTKDVSIIDSYRVGFKCFYGCSSLECVTFLSGEGADGSTYINESNYETFTGTASDFKLIIYVPGLVQRDGHAANSSGIGTVENVYYALNFYESQDAADADPYCLNAPYQGLYKKEALVADVLTGTEEPLSSTGTMPALADGCTWAAADDDLYTAEGAIDNCVQFFPAQMDDLAYSYTVVPETVYLADGVADLSDISVRNLDGTLIDAGNYELVYLLVENYTDTSNTLTKNSDEYYANNIYTLINVNDEWVTGEYMVYADGVGAYAGTTNGDENENSPTGLTGEEFTVTTYSTSVATYTGTNRSYTLGRVELATQTALGSSDSYTTPQFVVVASADNPQHMLIATWVASVGGGTAVFTDGADTHDYVYSAAAACSVVSNKAYVVGGEEAVGSEVMERLEDIMGKTPSTFTVSDSDDVSALAAQVYTTMAKLGYDTGDAAIVTSGTHDLANTTIANYAYQAGAPVFFTDEDGGLSAETLSALQAGGFAQVIVAGPESYVATAVEEEVAAATGAQVTRVASAGTAFEASLEVQELCSATFVDDTGEALADARSLVVASGTDAAYALAAAQYAAASGQELVVLASSADAKALTQRIVENLVTSVTLVGDFTLLDAALAASCSATTSEVLQAAWDGTYADGVTLDVGDSFEQDGLLFTLGASSEVELTLALDAGVEECALDSIEREGVSYAVSAIGAGAFAGCAELASVTTAATSIGASAFAGCTALTGISTAATSIGASAFSGCTALASAKLTASGLKTIPASCFAGCSKLATVSITSTALTGVGSKAFYGCKKLGSITLKSIKLTSIGASAFAGCSAMTKATVSSKKLKTIGASAFSGCSKLTSVTLASTALTSVGAKAFYGCKKLKSLNLKSAKLKSIGASAFQGCSAMTKLTVSSTALTKVGAKALYGCKKLKTLTLKTKKLKTVGKNALKGTTKSLTVKVPKAKVAKYKKLLQKKGLNKKAKVKAA